MDREQELGEREQQGRRRQQRQRQVVEEKQAGDEHRPNGAQRDAAQGARALAQQVDAPAAVGLVVRDERSVSGAGATATGEIPPAGWPIITPARVVVKRALRQDGGRAAARAGRPAAPAPPAPAAARAGTGRRRASPRSASAAFTASGTSRLRTRLRTGPSRS